MKKFVILSFTVMLILTGCASKNDVSLMDGYYKANTEHNVQQTEQVTAKSNAIKNSVTINCNEADPNCAVAKAMAGVVSAMFISNITPQEFTPKAPTTGVNVQEKALSVIGGGIPWLTIGVVATKGIDSAGDTTTASDGSTVTQNKAGGDVSTSSVEEVPVTEEEVINEGAINETKATE